MGKVTVTCVEWKPITKNTLRGFCTVDFKELRLKIHEIAVHEKDSRRWVALPSKPQMRDGQPILNENGKPAYSNLMTFDSREIGDAFSRAVIDAVVARAPDAFDAAERKPAMAARDEMNDEIPF